MDSAAFYWQFKRNEDTIVKKTYFFRDDEYVRYNDDQLKVRLITKTKIKVYHTVDRPKGLKT